MLCFSFCEILLCWNVLVSPFGHFDIFLPRVARKALAEWRLFHVSTKHSCSTHVCLSYCTSLWHATSILMTGMCIGLDLPLFQALLSALHPFEDCGLRPWSQGLEWPVIAGSRSLSLKCVLSRVWHHWTNGYKFVSCELLALAGPATRCLCSVPLKFSKSVRLGPHKIYPVSVLASSKEQSWCVLAQPISLLCNSLYQLLMRTRKM